jgi:GMP synthase PP-ATPase subunit
LSEQLVPAFATIAKMANVNSPEKERKKVAEKLLNLIAKGKKKFTNMEF